MTVTYFAWDDLEKAEADGDYVCRDPECCGLEPREAWARVYVDGVLVETMHGEWGLDEWAFSSEKISARVIKKYPGAERLDEDPGVVIL